MLVLGLSLSKEFDDQLTHERLRKFAEENFEPRYFGLNDSQFGFWFNLGENWPRGQLSALAMCSEVCDPGAWEKLFNEPNLTKYYSPSVEGIDYPAVAVQKAFHDDTKGKLFLKINDGNKTKTNNETSFKITNLPEPEKVTILRDGKIFKDFSVQPSEVVIKTNVGSHEFEIDTGYFLSKKDSSKLSVKVSEDNLKNVSNSKKSSGSTSRLLISSLYKKPCSCC